MASIKTLRSSLVLLENIAKALKDPRAAGTPSSARYLLLTINSYITKSSKILPLDSKELSKGIKTEPGRKRFVDASSGKVQELIAEYTLLISDKEHKSKKRLVARTNSNYIKCRESIESVLDCYTDNMDLAEFRTALGRVNGILRTAKIPAIITVVRSSLKRDKMYKRALSKLVDKRLNLLRQRIQTETT